MTDKDIWAIVQISIDPKFEIKDFLNELWSEWLLMAIGGYFINGYWCLFYW
jgi:hypothetical protein